MKFAFLTDFHLNLDPRSIALAQSAIEEALKSDAEVLVLGGDLVHESRNNTPDQVNVYWNRFEEAVDAARNAMDRDHRKSILFVIGNHDMMFAGEDSEGGKTLFKNKLKLWHRKYCKRDLVIEAMPGFSLGTTYCVTPLSKQWRFIVLDTILPTDVAYKGKLSKEQFEWLKELLKIEIPTAVFSHIPILTNHHQAETPFCKYEQTDTGIEPRYTDGNSLIVYDSASIQELFKLAKYKDTDLSVVMACLSGHLHFYECLNEDSHCNGTRWVCGATVDHARRKPAEQNLPGLFVLGDLSRRGFSLKVNELPKPN